MNRANRPPTGADDDAAEQRLQAARTHLGLGIAWKLRGNAARAHEGFARALELDPSCVEAHIQLANLALRAGGVGESLAHYQAAAALAPEDSALQTRAQFLSQLIDAANKGFEESAGATGAPALIDQPGGKLNLRNQKTFACHRGGWSYVLAALRPFHHRDGMLFDGFIENNFAWRHWSGEIRPAQVLQQLKDEGVFAQLATSAEQGITPYREPWVGVLHNPPHMPHWFHSREAPQTIFGKAIWRESLPHCRGLFAFSEDHAQWLRAETGLPVSSLVHPTEIPAQLFDFEAFRSNPVKQVVQVGWWLRRLNAIYELPLAAGNALGYVKTRLVPRFFAGADTYLRRLMATELVETGTHAEAAVRNNTRELQHLSNAAYDELLTRNIVFMQLYDASANNAVVECLARATPLLINRLPAVVEYLGAAYPLYYDDLADAAAKALDLGRLQAAHQYLLACETRPKLGAAYFQRAFQQSEVYQRLLATS
jgi:hypothetical protein